MSWFDDFKKKGEENKNLATTSPAKALENILQDLPVREKYLKKDKNDKVSPEFPKQVQNDVAKIVIEIICSIKPADFAKAVKELNNNDIIDTLMKYIYRGFQEEKDVDFGALLKAHDEVYKKNGTGPIIRSIHSRLEV
uniref:Actin-related protein 2/3 complex subunit 5 n=1 Tax=Coptotermes formosanus TaxID=36987 RepID=R4UV49_COPFO|nr:actin-related protein [Coptotermes formosanus]